MATTIFISKDTFQVTASDYSYTLTELMWEWAVNDGHNSYSGMEEYIPIGYKN